MNQSPLVVAAKGIVFYKGKALILREALHYKTGSHAGKFDIAGGQLDPDEPYEQALIREAFEEIGIPVQVNNILHVSEKFQPLRDVPCQVIRMYFSCSADTDNITLLKDAFDHYEWIDPAKHHDYPLIDDVHDAFDAYLSQTAA